MTTAQAVWLGIVQGLTEFLPISSSAHLILVRELFGWDAGAAEVPFDVACHLGTLAAVLVYFRRDVLELTVAAPRALAGGAGDAARTGRLILLATVPVVPLGLLLSADVDRLRGPAVVAAALAAGAVAMLWADRGGHGPRRASSLSVVEALLLGCAQAAALVPGVSRSGAVITAALLLGVARPEAARFAFLLGIPAIAGGGLQAARMLGGEGLAAHGPALLAGLLASGVVGYLAVAGLLRYLARHSLAAFAWYRLAVAAALAVALALGR
ncbi:MAG: undecaprenyl-diphosphate phosphatase [Acidobacteria bacterium]|nr:undecaprenyl-diphosphate phosphatase [Acidobacteriota bacterium]